MARRFDGPPWDMVMDLGSVSVRAQEENIYLHPWAYLRGLRVQTLPQMNFLLLNLNC